MNKIFWLRKELGLSMEEFGKMLGISRVHVNDCEKNKRSPSSKLACKIVRLAELYGIKITLEDIFM